MPNDSLIDQDKRPSFGGEYRSGTKRYYYFRVLYFLKGLCLTPFMPVFYLVILWDNYCQENLNRDNRIFWPKQYRLEFKILELYTCARSAQRTVVAFFERFFISRITTMILWGALVVMPLAVIGFACYKANRILNYSGRYQLNADKANIGNKNLQLYIDGNSQSGKFGDNQVLDNQTFLDIKSTPLTLKWKPEEYPYHKNVDVSLNLKGEGNWDISLVCPDCDSSKKYDWKPFFRSSLTGYSNAAAIDGVHVYSSDSSRHFDKANNLTEWLEKNAKSGESIDNAAGLVKPSAFENKNVKSSPGVVTTIDNGLRGQHTFYLFLDSSLSMQIAKRDLNWYQGSDAVLVSLYNLDGTLLYKDEIADDNDTSSDSVSKVVEKKFETSLPYKGVYKLVVDSKNSSSDDWVIDSLSINTDKVVLAGQNFITKPTLLYTENAEMEVIDMAENSGARQGNVEISSSASGETSTKSEAVLSHSMYSPDKFNLEPGAHSIKVNGDQYVKGRFFALNKNNYFEPFIYNFNHSGRTSLVISPVAIENKGDYHTVTASFTPLELSRLHDKHEIRFELRNYALESSYLNQENLQFGGYNKIGQFSSYDLWHKSSVEDPAKSIINQTTPANLSDWLRQRLPRGSSITVPSSTGALQNDLLNKNDDTPAGFSSTLKPISQNSLSLRGEHTFYLYLDGELKTEITKHDLNWYQGSDEVDVELSNRNHVSVCKGVIPDDGNTGNGGKSDSKQIKFAFNCPNLERGYYYLHFYSGSGNSGDNISDFLIEGLEINTNKIIALQSVLNTGPLNLYSSYTFSRPITLNYWMKEYSQSIDISGSLHQVVELGSSDLNNNRQVLLPSGETQVTLPKGYVHITGSDFAFSPEGWFDANYLDVTQIKGEKTDYVLTDSSGGRSALVGGMVLSVH